TSDKGLTVTSSLTPRRGRIKQLFLGNKSSNPLDPALPTASAASRAIGHRLQIIPSGIDIGKRPLVGDLEVPGRRRVRAHKRLGASGWIGRAQRVEQRSIDEQRVAMARAGRWTHDRRAR